MKRSAVVKLTGTPDELRNLLLKAIAREHGVTVQGAEYDSTRGVFEFTCAEGVAPGVPAEMSSTVVTQIFGQPPRSGKHKNRGLKAFLETLFTEFDRIPFDKLVEDCRKSGFNMPNHYLKQYIKTQIGVTELDPGVFGLGK